MKETDFQDLRAKLRGELITLADATYGRRYWKSRVLRPKVLGDEDDGAGRGLSAGEEVA